ncbi:MAG: hypothetical protein JWN03_1190 [Nocardia sp.]|uniref:hypothetical protein n=1 Tax=Nocardia sp. TaxID=1821 RepID=UPI00262B2189|nr:hypothetical protein [Nocardia sp.]MCU1640915.1 hypothetical protein [Nocardia sp.]
MTTKNTAKKAAPRRRPARPTTSVAPAVPASDRVDILDDLGTSAEPPVPITLLGVEADVRRSFSGAEAVKFYQLISTTELEAMLSLITSDGPGLWAKISEFTPAHATTALNRIINLSGLHSGELLAPLPLSGYMVPTAGAQPSPDATAGTA